MILDAPSHRGNSTRLLTQAGPGERVVAKLLAAIWYQRRLRCQHRTWHTTPLKSFHHVGLESTLQTNRASFPRCFFHASSTAQEAPRESHTLAQYRALRRKLVGRQETWWLGGVRYRTSHSKPHCDPPPDSLSQYRSSQSAARSDPNCIAYLRTAHRTAYARLLPRSRLPAGCRRPPGSTIRYLSTGHRVAHPQQDTAASTIRDSSTVQYRLRARSRIAKLPV
eukprot:3477307-Rhodomonas_salina.3